MKPFDLQKAIEGHPLVTRDGRKVEQFFYFDKVNEAKDLLSCIAIIGGAKYGITKDGWNGHYEGSSLDLFLAPTTYYVNVYYDGIGDIVTGEMTHNSDQKAISAGENCTDQSLIYIKTISFEI